MKYFIEFGAGPVLLESEEVREYYEIVAAAAADEPSPELITECIEKGTRVGPKGACVWGEDINDRELFKKFLAGKAMRAGGTYSTTIRI